MAPKKPDGGERDQVQAALQALWFLVVLGVLGILVHSWKLGVQVAAMAVLVGGAALFSGGLLGFLFGVPRSLQADNQASGAQLRYQGSTSLEQISDWLTKIIVGVTLTQIPAIGDALGNLGSAVSTDLGGSSPTFSIASCVYFAASGFLIGYLWSRIRLPRAFSGADLLEAVATKTVEAHQEAVDKAATKAVNEIPAAVAIDTLANRIAEAMPAVIGQEVEARLADQPPPANN